MQNARTRIPWLAALLAIAGCAQATNPAQLEKIDAGSVALGGRLYDMAIADANAALEMGPNADALYVRGRAEEERPKSDSSVEAADFAKAKKDYQSGLDLHPDATLDARLRAGLANIAYAQEDYATALQQWTQAIDHLDRPEWRGPALYRVGVCQQRLGHFGDADSTFQQVIQEYPDTDLAQHAKSHLGARSFYVQIGEYTKPADAANAVTQADAVGVKAHAEHRADGLEIVQAGPYAAFADASKARNSIVAQFPDAVITP